MITKTFTKYTEKEVRRVSKCVTTENFNTKEGNKGRIEKKQKTFRK